MPVSDVSNISPIMSEVQWLRPRQVMDLGVGVGKYGMLCREVLDGVHGRVARSTWEAQIVGVEAFETYRNPAWEMYDRILTEDITACYACAVGFDLVLMIDSLEHIEEIQGHIILNHLVKNNKYVIISVPLGNCPQGAVFGNEFERHRTTFTGHEFNQYQPKVLHTGVCHVVSIKGEK